MILTVIVIEIVSDQDSDSDSDSDGDSDCDGEFFTSTILSDDPPSGKLRKVSSSVDDETDIFALIRNL